MKCSCERIAHNLPNVEQPTNNRKANVESKSDRRKHKRAGKVTSRKELGRKVDHFEVRLREQPKNNEKRNVESESDRRKHKRAAQVTFRKELGRNVGGNTTGSPASAAVNTAQ